MFQGLLDALDKRNSFLYWDFLLGGPDEGLDEDLLDVKEKTAREEAGLMKDRQPKWS